MTPLCGSLHSGSDSVGEAHGARAGTGAVALGRRIGVHSVFAEDRLLIRRQGLGGGRRPARRRGCRFPPGRAVRRPVGLSIDTVLSLELR